MKRKNVKSIMATILTVASLTSMVSPVWADRQIKDMSGKEVTLPDKINAYGDGWFAHNEVSIMLDNADKMVATSMDPEKGPWMYYANKNIGKAITTFGEEFNLEELTALKAQVVFTHDETLTKKLDSVNIKSVNVMFKDYDEMKKSITLSAEVLNTKEAKEKAEAYNKYLNKVLSNVEKAVKDVKDKPKVLHGLEVSKFNIDGKNTIIDQWITKCGGINVASDVKGNMQTVSMEQILKWNPDIIITGSLKDREEILKSDKFKDINAVKNNKVYANPKGVFLWDRYGVEGALQLQWAANLFHPDLFKVDITEEMKKFYKEFLSFDLTDEDAKLILDAKNPNK